MTVQSSARLSIASTKHSFEWDDPFHKGLLKPFDEKSVQTERRRHIVGDISGSRRPMTFIGSTEIRYLPASRHESTLRLRRLERKVLFWKNVWDGIFSLLKIR